MRIFWTFLALIHLSSAGISTVSFATEAEVQYGQYPTYHPPVFQRGNELSKPLPDGSPSIQEFLDFYSHYVHERIGVALPKNLTEKDIVHFPSTRYSYVGVTPRDYGKDLPADKTQFATSSFCQNCHDATLALHNENPAMRIPAEHSDLFANWSPYGEWSVSLMGLSARDPVFHAQVETERQQHPGVKPTDIDNVCYSCHGPMGERQLKNDTHESFNHLMIYSTPDNFDDYSSAGDSQYASPKYAKYGALARDSVSCSLCHHIGPENGQWKNAEGETDWSIFYGPLTEEYPKREGDKPGPPYPFTATFQQNLNRLYVPSDGLEKTEEPMLLLGMAKSEKTEHIVRSEYCGGCHVVIVPKIPKGYHKGGMVPSIPEAKYTGNPFTDPNVQLAYEQTTYFEYVVSGFPDKNIHCQTCHMPDLQPKGEKVASVSPAWYTPENPGIPERNYKRHRLLGINLFVHEMFQQFFNILGLADPLDDKLVPEHTAANLLNAEQSIVQHATTGPFGEPTAGVKITNSKINNGKLIVNVTVTNNSGHKFPSGAGFRRGFIELQILDQQDNALWVSGKTNQFGVILGKDGQPLNSEFTKDPAALQPHYQKITDQNQVQIYEVRTKNDSGVLTTQTLSLFDDVKDNRLLPSGWLPPEKLRGKEERFGLNLKVLANITQADKVDNDPAYNDPKFIGTDSLIYEIDLKTLKGKPVSIKAYMRYQTIPPYFLVDRYVDGYQKKGKAYGPATNRLVYLTSRLNTNLGLKSANNSVNDFEVIKDWTMTLSQDHSDIQ